MRVQGVRRLICGLSGASVNPLFMQVGDSAFVHVRRLDQLERSRLDSTHRAEQRLQRPGGAVDVALLVPADPALWEDQGLLVVEGEASPPGGSPTRPLLGARACPAL